jgi:hypothetical protein
MLTVFEVILDAARDRNHPILSEETVQETSAQVMTPDEARHVGLGDFGAPTPGREKLLIAVNARDARWIQAALERSAAVTGYKIHEG